MQIEPFETVCPYELSHFPIVRTLGDRVRQTHTHARAALLRLFNPSAVTMADPAIQELKRNALILGAWLAAVRIAPYVCHALQSKN